MSFKFQPILNLRKHHEDHCRARLKEEQTKLQRIEDELTKIQATKRAQETEAEKLAVGAVKPEYLLFGSAYLGYLRRKQEETKGRRAQQREKVDKTREALIQARKETKVMEKLKEKKAREEAEERLRLEQKTLDEMAINQIYHS
ncbi:MAG TPA: flagellar export protein FliJ [Firmicutes bacterium]|nr:flagellar export protein FliJ [Bacillota bacterium]